MSKPLLRFSLSLFSFISAVKNVYREIRIQKKFNNAFLIPYMKNLEIKYNGKFSDEQTHKILNYYSLYIASFLCSNYKRLYGKKLTQAERKRVSLFGILTPVGDDLFDIEKLDIECIRAITYHPENYPATTFASQVAKEVQSRILSDVPFREAYLEAAKNVLEIQIETICQTNTSISIEEMERITFAKGAYSVIIYHQTLDQLADEKMMEVLFLVGSLFQLGNDVFDFYKDVRDHIYTLVNTCKDFSEFKNKFEEKVRQMNRKIFALTFDKKNKREFCIIMNTVNARTLVAIEHFIRLEKSNGGIIDGWKLERKDLVVDMEKPVNILRWFKNIYRLQQLH